MTKIKKAGLPPGELVYTGKEREGKVRIEIIDYTEKKFTGKVAKKVEECFPFRKTPTVTWLNVVGIHDTSTIEKIGKHFDVHPLVLEDIANTTQRPKIEDFEEYLFLVLKMIYHKGESRRIITEQVSLILGPNFVISFQERVGDVFDPVRERIRNAKGRIRKMGSDYLAYVLVDAIIDNYFVILERIGEEVEVIEDELMEDPRTETLNRVYKLKRELIDLRKSVWPLREVVNSLQRGESKLIKKQTGIYLRDVYDHTIQVIDAIETFRDMVSGMLDLYLSTISNKMNEVMKVLTIIATIFIPLTFLAGIYGMNFRFMPELGIWWTYPVLLLVMVVIFVSMFLYFKRRGWV